MSFYYSAGSREALSTQLSGRGSKGGPPGRCTCVYQGPTGRTGLDQDAAGRQIVLELMKDGWLWDPSSQTASQPSGDEVLREIRKATSPLAVVLHGPDETMRGLFVQAEEAFKMRRRNRLLERYGRKAEKVPTLAILDGLVETAGRLHGESLLGALEHLTWTTIWEFSEFGLFFTAVEGTGDFSVWLSRYLTRTGITEAVLVDGISALPVW